MEKYVDIHQESYRLLEKARYYKGNSMDEDTMIELLKNNTKTNAEL